MRKAIRFTSVILLFACIALFAGIFMLGWSMPEQFSVVSGYELTLNGMVSARAAMSPADDTGQHSAVSVTALSPGSSYNASLKLFGLFPIKDITVKVVDSTYVIPCGTPFGIKMYTDGVLVVGMSDVDTSGGPKSPAKNAGVKVGDVIVSIDGQAVNTTGDVAAIVEKAADKTMKMRIRRDNIEFDVNFSAEKSVNENRYKAGLWVRDSSAGIGTLTYYVPGSNVFGGLGHAVCDVDTGEIIPIATGEVVPARIYSIVKGQKGEPGELRGGFDPGTLGTLTINSETGIYGLLANVPVTREAIPVAMKQQVQEGPAQIISTINGTTPEYYDIEIEQVRYNDSSPTRNMTIVIKDERLLEKTGGIIQGMSGSPIIQDGRLVGAITHVFVNDPTHGFAIFAENMLKTSGTITAAQRPAA